MKTWVRAFGDLVCGSCPAQLRRGEIVQLVEWPGIKRRKVRCPACAGEPAPDLPPLHDTTITPTLLLPSGPGTLPYDWKAR